MEDFSKVFPDSEAYKRCFNFKITSLSISSVQAFARQSACDFSDLSALGGNFSKEEQANLLEKAKTVLNINQFRQGFKDSVYFMYSGEPLPQPSSVLQERKMYM